MDIVHVTAEMAPVAKVGGLGDVVLGLSRGELAQGHNAQVMLPKYDGLETGEELVPVEEVTIVANGVACRNILWSSKVRDVPVLLVDPQERDYFRRPDIYGFHDDIERFLYFSAVVAAYLGKHPPDIIHCHDWHAAAVTFFKEPALASKIVLTMHTALYQGVVSTDVLGKIRDVSLLDAKIKDPDDPQYINILKGGIELADFVTTVSPTYAKELMSGQVSSGLQDILRRHRSKFKGVLNGVDDAYWDPSHDVFLPPECLGSLETLASFVAWKRTCHEALQKACSLTSGSYPIVSFVGRLIPEKGVALLEKAIEEVCELGGQFVLLGQTFDENIRKEFEQLARRYQQGGQVFVAIDRFEAFSHLIYAGSDMIVVPSRMEPCGLIQMIGARYGTVPIVHHTGGLADSVSDVEDSAKDKIVGFTFSPWKEKAFLTAVKRAIEYYGISAKWQRLAFQDAHRDFSWRKPTQHYLAIYESLVDQER